MWLSKKLLLAVPALGLVLGLGAFARAEDANPPKDHPRGKGSISGVVLKDGKPVAHAHVAVLPPPPHHPGEKPGGQGGGPGGKEGQPPAKGDGLSTKVLGLADKGGGGGAPQGDKPPRGGGDRPGPGGPGGDFRRPEPFAKGETDENGKFHFDNIPAGPCAVVAGLEGEGRGFAKAFVKPNANTEVEITLHQGPPPGEKGPGGPGGGDHPRGGDHKGPPPGNNGGDPK